jgi:hypothetical protein
LAEHLGGRVESMKEAKLDTLCSMCLRSVLSRTTATHPSGMPAASNVADVERYQPLVRFLKLVFALLSVILLGVDLAAGMP